MLGTMEDISKEFSSEIEATETRIANNNDHDDNEQRYDMYIESLHILQLLHKFIYILMI